MYVHEMFPQTDRAMRYWRTTCHQSSHCLKYPGEGNHIGNWFPPPPYPHFPCLWYAYVILRLHVPLRGRRCHRHPIFCATCPFPLSLPECFPLPGGPVLIRFFAPLSPNVSGSAQQSLRLIQVSLQSYPSEHRHYHRQGVLKPDVVPPAILPSSA